MIQNLVNCVVVLF